MDMYIYTYATRNLAYEMRFSWEISFALTLLLNIFFAYLNLDENQFYIIPRWNIFMKSWNEFNEIDCFDYSSANVKLEIFDISFDWLLSWILWKVEKKSTSKIIKYWSLRDKMRKFWTHIFLIIISPIIKPAFPSNH